MAISIHSLRASSERLADQPAGLQPDWGEHFVTVVAASIAVLVVASIAVLMGMA
jgi:hypothetical protein